MFGLPIAAGDARTALNEPFHAVVSAEIAIKYFGRTDVLRQQIVIENFGGEKKPFVISGVLEKQTRNG